MANSRFAVAVHLLTLLEHEKGRPVSSDYAARSINTNPVVVRRLAGLLSRAGLVSARLGVKGGLELARGAASISLRDVYRAVEEGSVFARPAAPSSQCPVGRYIEGALAGPLELAERDLVARLERTTVADISRRVARAGRRPSRSSIKDGFAPARSRGRD